MIDIEVLKEQEPTFLQKAKKGYVCPVCSNGSGKDGTGITKQPHTESYKCFKCGFYGDVIDLYKAETGIQDTGEAIKGLQEYYSIYDLQPKETEKPQKQEIKQPEDFTEFYKQAASNNNFKYLQSRGISAEVQRLFNVGYVENWKSPQAVKTTIERGGNPDNLPTSPRCIIPRSKTNYLARDTRDNLTDEQKKYCKQNQGGTNLYNMEALNENDVVFIVEGEIDCMSIYEANGEAVALCSTSHARQLLKYLEEVKADNKFILMLDNDPAGQKASQEIAEGLEGLGLAYIKAEYPNNDPNEYLINDPEGMKAMISSLQEQAIKTEPAKTDNIYNVSELLDYFRHIEEQPAGFEAKTGFAELDRPDKNLFGGLHQGLYIVGAISSLGKTTFCLQLADQIAQHETDVIFFSLEQSKYELMAKSISRETYIQNRHAKDKDGKYIARETMQVLNNRRYKYYSPEEKKAITDGIEAYSKYADKIFIYEGRHKGHRLTVQDMKEIVKDHIEKTGRTPVVIADYLQIIAKTDPRQTDKQATDDAVFELKELSRNYNLPVIAISSFNRDNYSEPVSMASFKESGAIEYSSDVLIGLQFSGMEYIAGESEKDRKTRLADMKTANEGKKARKEPIFIDMKCLKNRNGNLFTLSFQFVNAFNWYYETIDSWTPTTEKTPFDKPRKKAK